MSDWSVINKHRVRRGRWASEDSDGFNGAFGFQMPGEARLICVIASDGEGWQHVSVSFGPNPATPSWKVMCFVKNIFWGEDQWVIQFHPERAEYVNNHAGCLHLWKPVGKDFPVPDAILVGVKGVTPEQIQKLKTTTT